MIYVDELTDYGKKGIWCHMATDTFNDLTELHEMADKIGLKREWFQDHPAHPHYDLRPSKRRLAVDNGATEVSNRDIVQICSRAFGDKSFADLHNERAEIYSRVYGTD